MAGTFTPRAPNAHAVVSTTTRDEMDMEEEDDDLFDPNYEFAAPQFINFLDSDESHNVSGWFDHHRETDARPLRLAKVYAPLHSTKPLTLPVPYCFETEMRAQIRRQQEEAKKKEEETTTATTATTITMMKPTSTTTVKMTTTTTPGTNLHLHPPPSAKLDRKAWEGAGAIGVQRLKKPAPTVPKSPMLMTRIRARSRNLNDASAAALPERQVGLPSLQDTLRKDDKKTAQTTVFQPKLTEPKSPMLLTKLRSNIRAPPKPHTGKSPPCSLKARSADAAYKPRPLARIDPNIPTATMQDARRTHKFDAGIVRKTEQPSQDRKQQQLQEADRQELLELRKRLVHRALPMPSFYRRPLPPSSVKK